MAITVRLTNKSQITRPETDIASDDSLLFSRAIYQILGSLIRNREMATKDVDTGVITIDWDKLPPAYAEFAEEMDRLWKHTFYPELVIAQGIPAPLPSTVLANEYLGDLGITTTYAYSKDIVNIPSWIDITEQSEYRVLIDDSDNTYLTDTNGTEILVSYTRNT